VELDRENKYEYIGMQKGDHGWCNGFEEQINWYEGKAPDEWVFDLRVQLKSKIFYMQMSEFFLKSPPRKNFSKSSIWSPVERSLKTISKISIYCSC